MDTEQPSSVAPTTGDGERVPPKPDERPHSPDAPREPPKPTRYHGTVVLDPTRVGRDASRIAEAVIAHLSGIIGATVQVTIEIEAQIPDGASDQVVRTVTENSRTLKFTHQGFEKE